MNYKEQCEGCGHSKVAYTTSLNQPMVIAFNQLVEYYLANRQPCNINKDLDLDHNQIANFQKLKYFGIVQNIDSKAQWIPTQKGLNFYYGNEPVIMPQAHLNNEALPDHHPAWQTHNGERKKVFITEIVDTWPYKQKEEYRAEKGSSVPTLAI